MPPEAEADDDAAASGVGRHRHHRAAVDALPVPHHRAHGHRKSSALHPRVSVHLPVDVRIHVHHPADGQLADDPAHHRPLHRRVSSARRTEDLHAEARLQEHGRRLRVGVPLLATSLLRVPLQRAERQVPQHGAAAE